MRTQMLHTPQGSFEVTEPNRIMEGDGFYVSYNDHDISIYGAVTTALVLGQMQAFYILNGDHRAQYQALLPHGVDACLHYYRDHIAEANHLSEPLPEEVANTPRRTMKS